MKLQERLKLLKANRNNIMAVKIIEQGYRPESPGCKYQYEDGSICGASAMLTDEERKHVVEQGQNSCIISAIFEDKILNGRCHQTMIKLQRLHDNFVNFKPMDGSKFIKYLDKLIARVKDE